MPKLDELDLEAWTEEQLSHIVNNELDLLDIEVITEIIEIIEAVEPDQIDPPPE
jgi:S-methylmethionine-dependent homocysteine/selenocysteine methylase